MDANELYERANELRKEKKFDEALELVEELKKMNSPTRAYLMEIAILADKNSHVKVITAIKKILPYLKVSDPTMRALASDILDILGHSQLELGLHEEAFESLKFAAQLATKNSWIRHRWGALIFCANHLENFAVDDFRVLYSSLKKCFTEIKLFPKKNYAHEKIRVGFLSADFNLHVAMLWSWALVAGLDKKRFETYLYSAGTKSDVVSNYLHEDANTWRDISELTNEQAAHLIHDDEIDILFDLSGQTKNTRIEIAVYRPASVQISGIGYVNSTGLDAVDYFLTDVHCAGNPDYFPEKLLPLSRTHFCYAPTTNYIPAEEPPCVRNNFVTFGSFNKWNKITPTIFRTWKKILDAVPNSRLLLKNKVFESDDEKNFAVKRLESFGFDVGRVIFRPFSKEHMREYNYMDIALDTFPYTGGITTCEALYMGVPVVSLYGDRHGSRVGLGILTNVGLEDFAVDNLDDYIARAVMLANDRGLLRLLKKKLRRMVEKSPLMDAPSYIREVQDVFVKILDDAHK